MERNELLDKFLEMKCKQMLLKLWLMAKPGYVGSEIDFCIKYMDVQAKLDSVEEEMLEWLQANETFFRGADLEGYCQEYKISTNRQKEISKEILGREYAVEDLAELLAKKWRN